MIDHANDSLMQAHRRAVDAVRFNIEKCTAEDADEIVTAIVALVFETMKHYFPGGTNAIDH